MQIQSRCCQNVWFPKEDFFYVCERIKTHQLYWNMDDYEQTAGLNVIPQPLSLVQSEPFPNVEVKENVSRCLAAKISLYWLGINLRIWLGRGQALGVAASAARGLQLKILSLWSVCTKRPTLRLWCYVCYPFDTLLQMLLAAILNLGLDLFSNRIAQVVLNVQP